MAVLRPPRIYIGRYPEPPDGVGGNDPSPNAPTDEVNDSLGLGSSETAPPDFNGTFAALEQQRDNDERIINRALGQAAAYQFPAIEGYTPYDDPDADQDLIDRHLPRFLDVRSPDARRAMEHALKREESEGELLHSSGWMGAVAAASTGRPALATWIPGRVEYDAGDLKYRPGHATLGYGFPDIQLAAFDGRDGSSKPSGTQRKKATRRIDESIQVLDVVEVRPGDQPPPPPPDGPSGRGTPYDPPASHENDARAVENVEAPRQPPLGDAEALDRPRNPVVEETDTELPAVKPANSVRTVAGEPNPQLSKSADANPEHVALAQQAPAASTSAGGSTRPGWLKQFKLSQTAAEYSSIEGAKRLYQLARVAKWLEENPTATDQDLLTQFTPGLLRIRWAERRQVMIDYFRGAPKQLEEVRQKLADYEVMESSGSIGDFTAWLAGQATGGWRSPEYIVGGAGKGASLLGRALWTGLKQFGVAAASDATVQWLLVKAGFQKEFDPVQTVTSAVTAGAISAAGKAGADGVRLGIKAKSSAPGGKAPAAEAPSGVRSEEPTPAAVGPKGEAPDADSKKPLTAKERAADLELRVAEVKKMAAEKPVSNKYDGAKIGETGHNDYARTFHQANGTLGKDVEVHHAVEQKIESLYPGLFKRSELNSLENLRGIQRNGHGSALHRSILRMEWDTFYDRYASRYPTKQEVLDHATAIDRKYGGLFYPPL